MGIQFLELSTEQRDAIERHLANLVASQLGATRRRNESSRFAELRAAGE